MKGSIKALSSMREAFFEAIFPGTSQKVAFTTSTQSTALQADTTVVRLVADAACYILIGSNPTALSDGTSVYLPANVVEYFAVSGAPKVAALQVSAGGNLWITEGASN